MIDALLLYFRSHDKKFSFLSYKTYSASLGLRRTGNSIATSISRRAFISIVLTILFALMPISASFAEAPVVDDSENFELFEQQATRKGSAQSASNATRQQADHLETPLAHEDKNDSSFSQTEQQVKLVNTIQTLQQDIQELRGQLEVQAHELTRLREQQIEFYKDLDSRLRTGQPTSQKKVTPTQLDSLSATQTPIQTEKTSQSDITTNQALNTVSPRDEKSAYMSAYALVNNKQFDEALPAMETFISHYPEGGYTANAHYWAGELYMVRKQYTEAIQHFETVLQKFPSSSKSSACLLKIGYALAASGDLQQAKQKLQRVVQQYPDTHAAQLAIAKLDSLGHP